MYYTHRGTWGHLSRLLNIARELKERGNEVLIINGGTPQDAGGFRVHGLPLPLTRDEWLKKFYSKNWESDMERFKTRLLSMKKAAVEFQPDVFITECFPFGREDGKYELVPLIKYLKKRFSGIKIVSSLGYPLFEYGVVKYAELYDRVMIHTPEGVDSKYVTSVIEDKESYERVFTELGDKLVFTGYVTEQRASSRAAPSSRRGKLVVVSRGGGIVCPEVVENSILSAEFVDASFMVFPGASSSKDDVEKFEKLAQSRGNVEIVRGREGFEECLSACDVSVNMAGYNTCVSLLRMRKRSVTVPFITDYDKYEQAYRSLLVKELLGATVMEREKLDGAGLAESIKYQLERNDKVGARVKGSWFDGAKRAADVLEGV